MNFLLIISNMNYDLIKFNKLSTIYKRKNTKKQDISCI